MEPQDNQLTEIKHIIELLGSELHWSKDRSANISRDTSLDKNLGLDSLSRVELMGRVERAFHVSLGEQAYAGIETVGDLIEAVTGFEKQTKKVQPQRIEIPPPAEDLMEVTLPFSAATINDVLEYHTTHNPNRIHLVLHENGEKETALTYRQLCDGAMHICAGLRDAGIGPGDAVALMLPTSINYFVCFLGTILAGAVPVPIYPPTRPSQLEDHLIRHSAILKNCGAKLLVTTPTMEKNMGRLLQLKTVELQKVMTPEDLKNEHAVVVAAAKAEDTAFLQYTSGSTGNPKGVVLSHANLLVNIRAMGSALEATSKDVFVSWLPLYHDMGLIGAWLGSLYYANRFVVMSPFAFLSRPYRWLSAIQTYGGTITAAPNFAYELCLRHITDEEVATLDLKTLRIMCNGAEAVVPETVERFIARFSAAGLNREALLPVYGLAESTVGLSFPPLRRIARIDAIDRQSFLSFGQARPARVDDPAPMRFVGCGKPLVGHEIRIVDSADHEVAERQEGYLQFRGPSSTVGYLHNEEQTKSLFHGAWLDSGDLGYLAEGDLFVTGRVKDIIKHAGRNIHPEELETAIGGLQGVRKGCVAVFGASDPKIGTEKLVVIAETRETDPNKIQALRGEINQRLSTIIGSAPDDVVLAPPHSVLKTSSGKVRRSASRVLYETGKIGSRPTHLRWQIAHFALAAASNRFYRILTSSWAVGRSIFIWVSVVFCILVFWPFCVLSPTLDGRWRMTRRAAALAAFIANIRISISGEENKLPVPCIFVANHSSYADALVLCLAFKSPVTFIAKAELGAHPLARWTFERLGVVFVERYDRTKALEDTKRTVELVKQGVNILSFPEGTFTRKPGLLPFHLGPFSAAVDTGRVIAPIAIKGTRSVLHPDSWILRAGQVIVRFLPTIDTRDDQWVSSDYPERQWTRAIKLRDKARAEIIEFSGEVDLGQERVIT